MQRPVLLWKHFSIILLMYDTDDSDFSDDENLDESFNTNASFKSLASLKGILIAHLNICSLLNKIDHVRSMAVRADIDILFLTETWLDPSIDNEEVNIPGYYLLRLDRDRSVCKSRGGGVCVYIRNKYKCTTVTDVREFTKYRSPKYIL